MSLETLCTKSAKTMNIINLPFMIKSDAFAMMSQLYDIHNTTPAHCGKLIGGKTKQGRTIVCLFQAVIPGIASTEEL